MADMAAGAVLAGSGNSGDAVRIVTDITAVWCEGRDDVTSYDETMFWRVEPTPPISPLSPPSVISDDIATSSPGSKNSGSEELSSMAVVALVKFFVLEWSVELDYQMYHDLPLELYLG